MLFKRLTVTIICSALFAGAVTLTDPVLKEKSDSGIKQGLAMYCQPRDSVDVLVLGSSHVHFGLNTAKLWDGYGIPAYDYSSAEQSLWVSYHYLVEFCKYQKPKVVVLDFFSPAAFGDDYKYKYTYMDESLYGMKFSVNKLMMMNACFDGKRENWDKYFPSYFGYHDRYGEISAEDIGEIKEYDEKLRSFKGFTPAFAKEAVSEPQMPESGTKAPSDKSVRYLDKIVEYTGKNDMQLYITVIPYLMNIEQEEGVIQHEDLVYNWLEEEKLPELKKNGADHVYFDYTVRHINDMNGHEIDFTSGEDVADSSSHLNYYGSCKFTGYLAEDLIARYGRDLLPDRRDSGSEVYSSWDEHVDALKKRVKKKKWEWR